jgi:hypothetical protein
MFYCSDGVKEVKVSQLVGSKGRIAISLIHREFQFTIYNAPTNALACNKTLIQMMII